MSATLKRSLRQRRVLNYLDVSRGKSSDVSFSDQNDSNASDKNASTTSTKKSLTTSTKKSRVTRSSKVLTEQNRSTVESDPDYSVNASSDDSDGDELFSKKIKISEVAKHTQKASISMKRVSVPDPPSSRLDKNVDLAGLLSAVDDDDDGNEYRRERQKQLLDRQMVLSSLDFDEGLEEFKNIAKASPKAEPVRKISRPSIKRVYVKRDIITSRRRSERLQSRSIDLSLDSVDDDPSRRRSSRLNAVSIISYKEGGDDSQSATFSEVSETKELDENLNMESEEDLQFLESVKDAINIPYDSVSDFTTCDFDKFKETLNMCRMFSDPAKVIESRIVSMDFHPSEKKLLLLIGDKKGNVALRDLATYEGVELKGHEYNTNCLKFSLQDSTKFYSTSLDGTVRIGDINTSSLNLLYKSDYHTTWHHESGNTLYIAEGNGCVRLLDLRSPNSNPPSFHCYKRSVRTVQTHPLDENYLLTSSGTGYFGIWDVRNMKANEPEPIMLETFAYALTSAFYSAKGNYVLTTCNDDTVCVFDVTDNKSKKISSARHNNHTGRWLSVFKANWQPNREDCYYIGSMMHPRRMQAYSEKSVLVREFQSDSMLTVNSVISVHPTKPIIVGGNGSGKIHIFSPFRDLSDI